MTDEAPRQEVETSGGADVSFGAVARRLGPAAWLGLAWTVLPAVMGILLVTRFRGPAAEWLGGHDQWTALGLYVGIFALTAGFGLLPTVFQALIGGYVFGLEWGVPGALAGFTLASLIGYAISRLVARHKVEAEIERHTKALAVRDALVGGGPLKTLGLVTLVRVPPNSPFALTNLVLTSVEVPLWIYVVGTMVGMLPRTAVVVWLGTQVNGWDEDPEKPVWLLWGGIVLTVFVLALIAQIANRAIERVTRGDGVEGAEGEGK